MSQKKINTRVADLPHGIVSTAVNKFWEELGPDGARVVEQLKSDPHFRRRLARFAATGYTPSTDQRLARAIFGKSFLGPEEVAEHFGVTFTANECKALAEIPWNEGILQECRDTHILVAGYPMTLMDVHTINPELMSHSTPLWYARHPFSKNEKVGLRWYLVRKDIVMGSENRTWEEQKEIVAEAEEVPRACELAYTTLLYRLARGEWAGLTKRYARSSSVGSDGRRVFLSASYGKLLVGWWEDSRRDHGRDDSVGVPASRKF